jgi:branched-subunit amino acid aminotransferase/4-amino-4-deoxychorismate lyase
MIVFFNGDFIDHSVAKISAVSSASLFGDGVFTTTLIENGKALFLNDHISRIKKHGFFLGLDVDVNKKNIEKLIDENNAQKGRWRLRITVFAKREFSLDLKKDKRSDILMTLYPILEEEKQSVTLVVYPNHVSYPLYNIKTLSYLNRFYLRDYAIKKGFDDALVLGPDKEILEGSFFNVFFVLQETLFIPKKSLPYFYGITLKNVVKKALEKGYKVKEGIFKLEELTGFENFYLCNSVKKIIPISKIGSKCFFVKKSFIGF